MGACYTKVKVTKAVARKVIHKAPVAAPVAAHVVTAPLIAPEAPVSLVELIESEEPITPKPILYTVYSTTAISMLVLLAALLVSNF